MVAIHLQYGRLKHLFLLLCDHSFARLIDSNDLRLPLVCHLLLLDSCSALILVALRFFLCLLRSDLRASTFALFQVWVLSRLRGQLHALDVHFVAMSVKLHEWITPLDSDALHALVQVLKLEVRTSIWALKLLVVIFEVDALVVVQIDHLCLALSLLLRP